MSEFLKLRLLIALVHLAGIVGLVFYWDPIWFGLTLISIILFTWFGHEAYCHRYLAHKSFKLHKIYQRLFAFLSIFNLFENPIGIVSTHVNHHKNADTVADPHYAPSVLEAWFWINTNLDKSQSITTVKRLMKDKWLLFILKYYFSIYFTILCIAVLINIKIAIYGFFLPVVYAFFCNGVVNTICHKYGYRRYQTNDNSANNMMVNFLLLGSGSAFHNNHHAQPWEY
jgi:stearoyl-CoA desaturase (delta-9 desaturase)